MDMTYRRLSHYYPYIIVAHWNQLSQLTKRPWVRTIGRTVRSQSHNRSIQGVAWTLLPFPDQEAYRVRLVNALKSEDLKCEDLKCVRLIPSSVSFWRWMRLGRRMRLLKASLRRASPRLRVTRLEGSFVVFRFRCALMAKSRDCRALDCSNWSFAIIDGTERWPRT